MATNASPVSTFTLLALLDTLPILPGVPLVLLDTLLALSDDLPALLDKLLISPNKDYLTGSFQLAYYPHYLLLRGFNL